MGKIVLTKPKQLVEIIFNAEQPFLDVRQIHFKTSIENDNYADIELTTSLKVTCFKGNIQDHVISIIKNLNLNSSHPILYDNKNLKNVKKIEAFYEFSNDAIDYPTSIEIEYENIARLDSTFPKNEFDEHLKDERNSKILFSAAFGQGKTTFLEHYFEAKKDKYRVFNIFPVNYSVSSNEDIFKYIKFEILLKLLDYPDYFDKNDTSYLESAENFGSKNLDKILAPLLLAIPKIGENIYSIFEKYDKLKSEYLKYHDSQQIDDKEEALEFIKQIYDKEGSIYEDTFYTQVIKQILEKLKLDSPNIENILIIEDLDRLDPDHIFRILNVLSAHFDSINFNQKTETNKFGFDRIILVCDHENIRHIYEHKFGLKVNFTGYISKFSSKSVFHFNNTKTVEQIINNIDNLRDNHPKRNYRSYKYLAMILKSLFYSNEISLRDLFKLRQISLEYAINKLINSSFQTHKSYYLRNSSFTSVFILLEQLGSTETLKMHVLNLKEQHFITSDIQKMCLELLVPLGHEINSNTSNMEYRDQERKKTFHLNVNINDNDGNFEVSRSIIMEIDKINSINYNFTFEDFKSLLIKNIEGYNLIKHSI